MVTIGHPEATRDLCFWNVLLLHTSSSTAHCVCTSLLPTLTPLMLTQMELKPHEPWTCLGQYLWDAMETQCFSFTLIFEKGSHLAGTYEMRSRPCMDSKGLADFAKLHHHHLKYLHCCRLHFGCSLADQLPGKSLQTRHICHACRWQDCLGPGLGNCPSRAPR